MEGRHVLVSVDMMSPYVKFEKEGDELVLDGYLIDIWKILEEKLKFTTEYIVENFYEGAENTAAGRRDILLRPIIVTSDDKDDYDSTVPLISTWYYLYMKDSDEINSSMSYIRNWSPTLWICTIIMVVIFTVLLWLMLRISNKYLKKVIDAPTQPETIEIREFYSNKDKKYYMARKWRIGKVNQYKKRVKREESLGNCFVTAIAAFCSQGCAIQSHMASIRILMLSFLVFGMIMYNAYAALLVSQLTLGERFIPFTSLHEIPEKAPGYSVCVREGSFAHYYFKKNLSGNEILPRWADIINSKPCIKGQMGELFTPDVMCSTHVAILESPSVMYHSISRNFKCKMTHLKDKYYKADMSVLILKTFPEEGKRVLNKQILRLREIGILKHLIKLHVKQEEVISGVDEDQQGVTYEHVEGVLIAFASCVGISWAILCMENLFFIFQQWSGSKKQNPMIFDGSKLKFESSMCPSIFSVKCWDLSVKK